MNVDIKADCTVIRIAQNVLTTNFEQSQIHPIWSRLGPLWAQSNTPELFQPAEVLIGTDENYRKGL